MKRGKEYELLIHQIYSELDPSAEIVHDEYIVGRLSKRKRQIDLTIRNKIVDLEILIIVQAKELAAPADVNVVGEFLSAMEDVGALKGILICNKGFTKGAVNMANEKQITLYSAHGAQNIKWHLDFTIPVIRYHHIYNGSLTYQSGSTHTNSVPDIIEYALFKFNNKIIHFGDILEGYKGKIIFDKSKENRILKFNTQDVYNRAFDNQYKLVRELSFEYQYRETKLSITFFKPDDYRLLKDVINNKIVHTHINWSELDNMLVHQSWTILAEEENIPFDLKLPHVSLNSFDFYFYTAVEVKLENFDHPSTLKPSMLAVKRPE